VNCHSHLPSLINSPSAGRPQPGQWPLFSFSTTSMRHSPLFMVCGSTCCMKAGAFLYLRGITACALPDDAKARRGTGGLGGAAHLSIGTTFAAAPKRLAPLPCRTTFLRNAPHLSTYHLTTPVTARTYRHRHKHRTATRVHTGCLTPPACYSHRAYAHIIFHRSRYRGHQDVAR